MTTTAPPRAVQHAAPTWHARATAIAQPVAAAHAPQPRPQPVHAAPRIPHPAPAVVSRTHAAPVAWQPAQPAAERTLLQRITPVHIGVLFVMAMVAMVVTSGPAAMNATPQRLPALARGGGATSDPLVQPRVGSAAVPISGAPAKARAQRATKVPAAKPPIVKTRTAARSRMLVVGSARLNPRVRSGGIPSPAAAANLAVAGGGRVAAAATGAVRMNGIPSPAAAAALGPQQLPFRPTDGVTLPRMVGERDSHAVDSHYGSATLPMEAAVAMPAMTPGAAAAQAERRVTVTELTGSSTPPAVNGGLIAAY